MLTCFVLSLKVSKLEYTPRPWLARLGVMPGTGIIKDTVNLVYLLSFCLVNYFWFGRETETKRVKYIKSCLSQDV